MKFFGHFHNDRISLLHSMERYVDRSIFAAILNGVALGA